MANQVARKYDSSRRQESARQTRLRVAEAARRLFQEHGYAGATIEAIAEEAGVAKETIYATFKNKRTILAFLLDISVGGDDRPVRIIDRPEVQAGLADPDQRRQIAAFSNMVAQVMSRAAPIFEITRIAAKTEPEVAGRVEHLYQERLQNMRTFVRALSSHRRLRGGLTRERAAEVVWGLSSPELFQLMTTYGGWSLETYAAWLSETLERTLLP